MDLYQESLNAARRLIKTRLRGFVCETMATDEPTSGAWSMAVDVEQGFTKEASQAWTGILARWNLEDPLVKAQAVGLVREALAQAVQDTEALLSDTLPVKWLKRTLASYVALFDPEVLLNEAKP
jgi:hypothetical protein